ncbi:MAG: succinic semialdehyde dehydrogenase, partial [Fluviibacter sp.]
TKDGSMGGHGESGIGRRHGSEGLLKFTEAQTVVAARFIALGPQSPLTGARWAALLAAAMRILKWLRRP